jgi:hypothetical protein
MRLHHRLQASEHESTGSLSQWMVIRLVMDKVKE